MRKSSVMCMAMPMMPMMAMARMGWAAWSRSSKRSMTPDHSAAWARSWQDEVCVEPRPQKLKNVVETARAAGSFGTLLEALKIAKLDGALTGSGPFTVFAPSDTAFAQVPAEALQGLLKDPTELTKVLKLHVVTGRLTSAELTGVGSLKTLGGQTLAVDTTDGVKVGKARVVRADIDCGNGVIHVLDSVLLPS